MKVLDWFRAQAEHSFPIPVTQVEREQFHHSGLDFLEAITAHQRWKHHLRDYVDDLAVEPIDYLTACRDDQCELGRWLHGEGRVVHGHRTIFSDLVLKHAQFHLAAGEIIRLKDHNDPVAARMSLGVGDFALKSATVQSLVSALFMELREPPVH
jgi:hypothetical protein